jgi:hypothetical protein
MVVTVVGDVKASEAMPIVEKYFSRIPARPKPDTATTTEPPQNSERRVVLHEQSQPFYLEGYHRPDYRSPDDQIYDAIADLMSNGRTSRLYRALVRDKQIASIRRALPAMPETNIHNCSHFTRSRFLGTQRRRSRLRSMRRLNGSRRKTSRMRN